MNIDIMKAVPRPVLQRGVTLIELLVGMLVGMMAVLVISQTLLTSESQKRTATGGSDAQVNAALALYSIQRDVQMAGYGLTSSPAVVGCPISARHPSLDPAQFPTRLVPVMITREADRPAGSVGDSIRLLGSSKPGYSVPTRVIPPGYNPAGGTEFPVRASLGFANGDLALAASNATNPCWVFQVTAAPPTTGRTLPRANDATGWNPANTPDVAYGDGAVLINLGALVDNLYEIDNTNNRKVLRISSFNAANPAVREDRDVQSDIVGLHAFYGRDTSVPPDGVVDEYDVPSAATQAAYTNADWLRILSVRVIIVSRSSTWEKREERSDGTFWYPTPANPEWSVGTLPAVSGAVTCASGTGRCITLDVGAGATGDVEAKHHRYKVFDTVIPLRNMLWSAS